MYSSNIFSVGLSLFVLSNCSTIKTLIKLLTETLSLYLSWLIYYDQLSSNGMSWTFVKLYFKLLLTFTAWCND